MRALTEVELSCINGSDGNDSYNPTSLIVGSLSTIAKLPTPVSLAVGVGTEIAIRPHRTCRLTLLFHRFPWAQHGMAVAVVALHRRRHFQHRILQIKKTWALLSLEK